MWGIEASAACVHCYSCFMYFKPNLITFFFFQILIFFIFENVSKIEFKGIFTHSSFWRYFKGMVMNPDGSTWFGVFFSQKLLCLKAPYEELV
ncbi:hypothetical protein GDO81_004503 [Engystomops pustulosus]|uniref:Uncharacterized protein n=1 Tax=Engystomops pustulosus TaxID=76066 RepID=A0AAV7A0B9_ENGPU|nr:hypothetical protein GDO81_004503 [Engystomops pustulosus]